MLGLESLGAVIGDPELRKLFSSVATRKISADLKMLQAHAELSRRLARTKGPGSSGDGKALKRIVREHLEYYGTLVDLAHSFHQRLLDMLAETERGRPAEPAINGLTLALRAPVGATVRAPFKISNNRPDAIQVTCRASPFVSEDGSQLVASRIAFSPPGADIQPGSEEVFEVILPVGSDFVAGRTYLATLSAVGVEAMEIVVRLTVEAATGASASEAVAEAAPQTAAEPSKPRRRRAAKDTGTAASAKRPRRAASRGRRASE